MTAKFAVKHGNEFPFDASDEWWNASDGKKPPKPTSKFHSAARGVLADLMDRRGIKQGFDNLDDSIRVEIVDQLAAIIKEALK